MQHQSLTFDGPGRPKPTPPIHVEQALQYIHGDFVHGSIDVTGVVVAKTHMIDGGFFLADLADSRFPTLKLHLVFVDVPIFWAEVWQATDASS